MTQYKITAPKLQKTMVSLPASKSISNRALIIYALSGGRQMPQNLSDCDDTKVILNALRYMPDVIDIKAAGTAMRFMTAYLSVMRGTHVLTGTARMKQRPIGILVDALRKLGVEVELVSRRKSASTIAYEEITRAMVQSHKIIVNATPVGMYPHVDDCPDFPYRFLSKEHLCYDLIYNPDETMFMRRSREAGAETKNGLEMLLLQAFVSYEIWLKGKYE